MEKKAYTTEDNIRSILFLLRDMKKTQEMILESISGIRQKKDDEKDFSF